MADQFVGEVRCVGFDFPPSGWAYCSGQLLAISSNTALFSLLGVQYGGNGTSNFGLPNLQGNVAIGQGNGAGLSPRTMGEQSGVSSVTLLSAEMPAHNHNYMINSQDGPAGIGTPTAKTMLSFGPAVYSTATAPLVGMAPISLGPAGGGLAHNNMMQYLTLNFVIALQGIFPARS